MKHCLRLVAALATLLLASACSSVSIEEAAEENGQRVLTFNVLNYRQERLGAPTRALTVDSLDHLAMAVYTKSGSMVTQQVQNKGMKGYGQFSVVLDYGDYDFVFVGYTGSNAINLDDPEHISFANDYVPDTFLKFLSLTWDDTSASTQTVSMQRRVGQFVVSCTDKVPSGVQTVAFDITGAGTQLNAKTGLSANDTRTVSKNISSEVGKQKNYFFFLYLPAESCQIQVDGRVMDAKNNVMFHHTFSNAPIAINQQTTYEGAFFTLNALGIGVTLDDQGWNKQTVKF